MMHLPLFRNDFQRIVDQIRMPRVVVNHNLSFREFSFLSLLPVLSKLLSILKICACTTNLYRVRL